MKNVLPVGFYCSLSIIEYNVQLRDETEYEKQEGIIKKNRALSVQWNMAMQCRRKTSCVI